MLSVHDIFGCVLVVSRQGNLLPGRSFNSTGNHRHGRKPNQLKCRQAREQADMGWALRCRPHRGLSSCANAAGRRRGTVFTARDVKITRTTQLGFSASAAGIACFRWRSAGQQEGRTGYMSKDKILQSLGAGARPSIVEAGDWAAAKAVGA